MGSIIKAFCGCGFSAEFFGGSGAGDYERMCSAPAVCPDCGSFETYNYLDSSRRCIRCGQKVVFYNHGSLQEGSLPVTGPEPELFILPRCRCLCPRCRQMGLRFEPVSCCE